MFEKSLVKEILKKAAWFKWSLQGFGMLRLHLSDEVRLNVWDGRYRVPNVSMIHDHPWDFESLIVTGELRNVRLTRPISMRETMRGLVMEHAVIKPGPGGGKLENKGNLVLCLCDEERYVAGQTYRQKAAEVHLSDPEDGTVTINKRERVGEDLARVFWPYGKQWVSAEPRPATTDEVLDIVGASLARWF